MGKFKKMILFGAGIIVLQQFSPAFAGGTAAIKATSEGNGSAHSAAALGGGTIEESNSTNTLNQTSSPTATQSNIAVQNNMFGMYGFGDGIYCSGPSLSISGFGSGLFNSSTNVGGVLTLNVPLGGRAAENCNNLTSEIVLQRQLDTNINLINFCRDVQKNGGRVTSKAPTKLQEACSYVDFSEPPMQVIVKEEETTTQTQVQPPTIIVPIIPREIETSPGLN